MPRNNPRGVLSLKTTPDNQQERQEQSAWICGFVDGEGCFSISIIRNSTTKTGWQVFPEFVVTQGSKSRSALEFIQEFFQCGRIYENRRHDNHKENILRYCVRSRQDLQEKIIPFFRRYLLRTAKKHDFEKFVSIVSLMELGQHKTLEHMKSIAKIIQTMNRHVPAKILESSETTRLTPETEMI